MAAFTDEHDKPLDIRMREQMTSFPCMFNMQVYQQVLRTRLTNRRDALLFELEEGIQSDEEQIKARNLLTWIYFQLGFYDKALVENESVLIESNYESIVALGNSVFMELQKNGRVPSHYNDLESIREKADFTDKEVDAKAEQAYCLAKLGGRNNQKNAILLYEDCLKFKEKDTWRYQLGKSYRRLSTMSNGKTGFEKAKDCFQKVSRSSNTVLKAESLANLAALKKHSAEAKGMGMRAAIAADPNNNEVCHIAGRGLINIDIRHAVTLLEKSVELCPSRSVLHHSLGKAYICQLKTIGRPMKNQLQEKAINHLRQAYERSHKTNISPLLDIARLLQGMGEEKKAKTEIMTFLTSRVAYKSYLTQVKMAHNHIFYLTNDDETLFHLLIAMLVSIAFIKEDLTLTAKECCAAVWSKIFENGQSQRHATAGNKVLQRGVKAICSDLKKFGEHLKRIIGYIKTLVNDGTIDDKDSIIGKANAILESDQQNEGALLFLELVSLRPGSKVSVFRDLYMQLIKTQALRCLQRSLGTSAIFFHQSFQLAFNDGQADENILGVEESYDDEVTKVDMVMLFNDSYSSITTSTICTNTAYGLDDVISTLFKLDIASNPLTNVGQQNVEQGNSLTDFVLKYTPNLIVIVFEGDGVENAFIWEQIAYMYEDTHKIDAVFKMPSVVLIQCHDQPTHLPTHMAPFPCLSLGREGDDAFPNLFCLTEAHEQADESIDVAGVVQAYFGDNIENVMTLFNHLIQKND